MLSRILMSVCIAAAATHALAHPGGLNADGCHTNRKTGEYHCHRPQAGQPNERPRGSPALNPARPQPDRQLNFGSCAEARAAGFRRMRVGEPGYSRRLDRDGDGIACE